MLGVHYKLNDNKIIVNNGMIYTDEIGEMKYKIKLFILQFNKNIQTTQTPEETHTKLIKYLKKGDFKNATECCFKKSDWYRYERGFNILKNDNKLDSVVSDLEIIHKDSSSDVLAIYKYDNNQFTGIKLDDTMEFRKDRRGVWLIESLIFLP